MNDLKKITIAVSSLPKNGWWNSGIVAYHDNDMMSNGAIPNQELLTKEHENLIDVLNKHSLKTIIIPFKSELEASKKYDFVFMRDHFLCNTNKDIVMCNMKLSERMDEGEYSFEHRFMEADRGENWHGRHVLEYVTHAPGSPHAGRLVWPMGNG